LTGTARYASINALKGVEQSRRDDLEAIGYVLMYFLRGVLPWQGLKVDKREDRYKKIYEKKKSTTPEELCNGYPQEFNTYVTYTRNLAFEQEPDYEYLRGLFKTVMSNNGLTHDSEYDWIKSKKKNTNSTNISRNVTNDYGKNVLNTNVSYQAVGTQENYGANILQTQNNVNMNIKKKLGDEKNEITNSHAMIHTQQNQECAINKPKTFIVNETNYKFIENNLNKSNQGYGDRTVTQSAVLNTHFNSSVLNTQQNATKKDKKLNISDNGLGGNGYLATNTNGYTSKNNNGKSVSVEKKRENDSKNGKKSQGGCLIF